MRFRLGRLSFLLPVLSIASTIAAQTQPSPDLQKLAQAAEKSVAELKSRGATWTATIDIGGGAAAYQVDAITFGDQRRISMHVDAMGRTLSLATITMRDGFWYVDVNGKHTKYRPYEGNLGGALCYALLAYSEPHFYSAALDLPKIETQAGGNLLALSPLDAQSRRQLEAYISQSEAFARRGGAVPTVQQQRLLDFAANKRNGLKREIDPATGCLVSEDISIHASVHIKPFRLIDHAPDGAFAIKPADYSDETQPLAADSKQLAMFRYLSDWQPGYPLGDMETVLVDLATGKWRRVPSVYESTPGCFSTDRSKVWVCSADLNSQDVVLHEIDLITGRDRPFGGTLAQHGTNFSPRLSPDGKHLALLHVDQGGSVFRSSTLVIDTQTQAEKIVGDPGFHSAADWADSDHLVLELRQSTSLDQIAAGASIPPGDITIVDLNAKAHALLRGRNPISLDSGTILFQQDGLWKTCNLEGKEVATLGDGFAKHISPSSSPDGKGIIMINTSNREGPQPVIISRDTGKSSPMKVGPGYWADPAWK